MTRSQILAQLKKNHVYLGRNPGRTFIYYQQLGLLPKSSGRLRSKKNVATFPDWIIDRIRNIKKYQKEGMKLSEIKKGLQESNRLRQEWIEILRLRNPEQVTNISSHVMRREKMHYFVSVFYPDQVQWFEVDKITDPYHIDKDIRVLDRNTLSWEEYEEFVGKLAVRLAKGKHVIIKDTDIPLAIFS